MERQQVQGKGEGAKKKSSPVAGGVAGDGVDREEDGAAVSSRDQSLRKRRNFRGDGIAVPPPDAAEGEPVGSKPGIQMLSPSRVAELATRDHGRSALAATVVLYLALVVLVGWAVQWAPEPSGVDAPVTEFSEGRALQHVEVLAGQIGQRQVSTRALGRAQEYIHQQLLALRSQAAASEGGVQVEVDVQNVSGVINMDFCHEAITNVYHNLTNLVLRITPAGAEGHPAVLLSSHYDSTIGSAGASDAASMIGIMLEIARLVIDPESEAARPFTPLILLFNGGEETLSQAAHGFAAHHPWAASIGAFINLESGGPHGLDVMFQSTGDWTSEAYARAAVYPRGNVMAQDVFRTGLIPADTDFRMFSEQHYGNLPGIDIAFLLGAHQYHTLQDVIHNIPRGTLQVMGENSAAAMREFSYELRFNKTKVDATDNLRRGQVYYDVLSMFMVTYPAETAAWLHRAPLMQAVAVLLTARGRLGDLPAIFRESLVCGASLIGACLAPSLLGALRVLLSGNPLSWFGRWWLACGMYIPSAAAGALAPRMLLPSTGDGPAAARSGVYGSSLFAAAVAWIASSYDIGSGYIFFLWASALLIASALSVMMHGNWEGQLFTTLGFSAFPALLSLQIGCVWLIHVWQKISMGGAVDSHLGIIVSDSAAGLLSGAVTWLSLLGVLPLLTMHRPTARRILSICIAVSVGVAILACGYSPYTELAPKRLLLQHYHVHDHLGRVSQSTWVLGAMDSVPAQTLLTHPQISGTAMPGSGVEWLSFYPLGKIVQTVVLEAPSPDPKHVKEVDLPKLIKRGISNPPNGLIRLELDVLLPRPAWGVMNITAPVLGWSLGTPMPLPSVEPISSAADPEYVVRFAGNEGSEQWSFWLDLPPSTANLTIQLAIMFLENTNVMETFIASLPAYTSPIPATTFASSWTFSLAI